MEKVNHQRLYIMIGVPGSGKTYYATHEKSCDDKYVSRDEIRFSLLRDREDYFSHEDEVIDIYYTTIADHLNAGHTVWADATCLNFKSRSWFISKLEKMVDFKGLDIEVVAVFMDTTYYECTSRNAMRGERTRVPDKAMYNMWLKLTPPAPDEYYLNKAYGVIYKEGIAHEYVLFE